MGEFGEDFCFALNTNIDQYAKQFISLRSGEFKKKYNLGAKQFISPKGEPHILGQKKTLIFLSRFQTLGEMFIE